VVRTVPKWLREADTEVADVFARNGYDSTRMEEIAVAAGVPRATLYYHFKGKDEVLAWLLGSTLEALGGAVGEAVSGRGSARRRLERVIRAQLRVMGERPGACRMLIADLERAGRMPDIARGVAVAFYLPVVGLLEEGKADGSLRGVRDPQRVASAIFGAVTIPALSSLVMDASFEAEAVARAAIDLILRGLAAD
jgi:AcrR family transcriptional regulator